MNFVIKIVISVYFHIRNTKPEIRICNTQTSDIHQDSFVGGSLVLVRHLFGHGLQECPPLNWLLLATTGSLPNSVLT